uniref:Uncharacterized protein n=1 Tax=Oryza brachyantha TaxID=4533 RepID=J3M5B1_ORYBR
MLPQAELVGRGLTSTCLFPSTDGSEEIKHRFRCNILSMCGSLVSISVQSVYVHFSPRSHCRLSFSYMNMTVI